MCSYIDYIVFSFNGVVTAVLVLAVVGALLTHILCTFWLAVVSQHHTYLSRLIEHHTPGMLHTYGYSSLTMVYGGQGQGTEKELRGHVE